MHKITSCFGRYIKSVTFAPLKVHSFFRVITCISDCRSRYIFWFKIITHMCCSLIQHKKSSHSVLMMMMRNFLSSSLHVKLSICVTLLFAVVFLPTHIEAGVKTNSDVIVIAGLGEQRTQTVPVPVPVPVPISRNGPFDGSSFGGMWVTSPHLLFYLEHYSFCNVLFPHYCHIPSDDMQVN